MKSSIPKNAEEIVDTRFPDGSRESAKYYVNGACAGFRCWDKTTGVLSWEGTYKDGLPHGRWREWHQNGQLHFSENYLNGHVHGLVRMWNSKGDYIGSYRMNHGTGVEMWITDDGLCEEIHLKDSRRHGYDRRWSNHRFIYSEGHFREGMQHGIFREWHLIGRQRILEQGYPKFFIEDKKVSKRTYLKKMKDDPTLPGYNEKDDKPYRQLPERYRKFLTKKR